jgi:hypothetical protein
MDFIAQRAFAITPHNSTNFAQGVCNGVWVGGAGIAVVVLADDTTANFTCVAGSFLPVRAKRINSTSTTATLMVALY